jgi:hypothetical protein
VTPNIARLRNEDFYIGLIGQSVAHVTVPGFRVERFTRLLCQEVLKIGDTTFAFFCLSLLELSLQLSFAPVEVEDQYRREDRDDRSDKQ